MKDKSFIPTFCAFSSTRTDEMLSEDNSGTKLKKGMVINMTLEDVREILHAQVLCGEENLSHEVRTACGSDMMSDVLAYVKDQAVLLTGLMNQQVVRTAEMMDMVCVVFVRDKTPDDAIVALAREKGISVMTTPHRMFTACGLLYQGGLKGGLHHHE